MLTVLSIAGIVVVAAWWVDHRRGEVNGVISDVRCSWSPERIDDVVITGTVRNPSSRSRDFELTGHVSLPGALDQRLGGGSLVLAAHGSRRFSIEQRASGRSPHGSRLIQCGAAARSFTPSGDD